MEVGQSFRNSIELQVDLKQLLLLQVKKKLLVSFGASR